MPVTRKIQTKHTVSLTTNGDGDATDSSITITGVLLGAFIEPDNVANADVYVYDSQGYDILQGLGIDLAASTNVQLNAEDVGGNPVHGNLTVTVAQGGNTKDYTVTLYVLGQPFGR
jgi:hypothetical protein